MNKDATESQENVMKASNFLAENISEIQCANSLIYGKINECLENGENPKIYIESLKELLSMQENLSRLSMEMASYIEFNENPFADDFLDED